MTIPKEIHSLQHPLIKNCVKVRTSRKERYEKELVLIAGKKLVQEANAIEILFVEERAEFQAKGKETYIVSSAVMKKITGLEAPEGIAALVPLPKWDSLQGKTKILGLDQISDPGNLGTLLRTALALGWEGAFLTDTCVDPFNDKALRSAKGATFRLPLKMGSLEELLLLGKEKKTWYADMKGTPLSPETKGDFLILGNEASGVNPSLKKAFNPLSIPISGIESLNVAAAGAIFLYQLRP